MKYFLVIYFSILVLPASVFPESGTEKLDAFYAKELTELNEGFESLIEQLDKCLGEMDKWEQGDVFLEPVECLKLNEMRLGRPAFFKEVEAVVESTAEWLNNLPNQDQATLSLPAADMTLSLLQVFSVKHQQVKVQTERIL